MFNLINYGTPIFMPNVHGKKIKNMNMREVTFLQLKQKI